jgi:hypothetical protein
MIPAEQTIGPYALYLPGFGPSADSLWPAPDRFQMPDQEESFADSRANVKGYINHCFRLASLTPSIHLPRDCQMVCVRAWLVMCALRLLRRGESVAVVVDC